MIWAIFLIFLAIAAVATAFVAWPILNSRSSNRAGRTVLAAAAALFVLGAGGGLYLYFGRPSLAARTFENPRADDFNSMVSALAMRARAHPTDLTAWTYLWKSYLYVKDARDAGLAFRHAVGLAPPSAQPDMYDAYGEALILAAGGMSDESEAAFRQALARDPKNLEARYYMGVDYAARGDNAAALSMWEGLLSDVPANSRIHGILVDRIAALKAANGSAPDIGAMVAGLAARLKANPDDAQGWQRLVRAYVVLGDMSKARAALTDARIALRAEPAETSALDVEARKLKLDK